MGPEKGIRVKKIQKFLLTVFLNFSWGTQQQISSGGGRRGRPRTKKCDTETEGGGEAGPSQSRYKKGHMANIYLMDSDEEAIVNFVKDHKELYDKTNEHFGGKARKESLFEQFLNSRNLPPQGMQDLV